MQIRDLAPNSKNPRKITEAKQKMLLKALRRFGDLSGLVFNRKSKQLVGGHQRRSAFSPDTPIVITKKYSKPTKTGTVAEGYIEAKGERFSYREVHWDEHTEKAANIAANKGAGVWDPGKLKEWIQELNGFDVNFDLDLTMFDADEIKDITGIEVSAHTRKAASDDEETQDDDEGDVLPEVIKPRAKLSEIYKIDSSVQIHCGDSLDWLKTLKDDSVDSVVTDPPYGLEFMGKKWDYDVPSTAFWEEVVRIAKPGAHILAFGGTRTYHRMVVAMEDAGLEIRDQLQWIYGSGFPKSLDVSKAIDKAAGAERTEFIVDEDFLRRNPGTKLDGIDRKKEYSGTEFKEGADAAKRFVPATPDAKRWSGWGTALKPANEPIVLARKPLEKGLTVAENVLKWGTGALNVDTSRIALVDGETPSGSGNAQINTFAHGDRNGLANGSQTPAQGRWPANVLFDEEAAAMLDEQSGKLSSGANPKRRASAKFKNAYAEFAGQEECLPARGADTGGASRFFYVAKSSKAERNAGLDGMPERESGIKNDSGRGFSETDPYRKITNQNHHPTVKPVRLMEYLCRLVTPPGGIVLEPFGGSGTTALAALRNDFKCMISEREPGYTDIILARLEKHTGLKARLIRTETKRKPSAKANGKANGESKSQASAKA